MWFAESHIAKTNERRGQAPPVLLVLKGIKQKKPTIQKRFSRMTF